MASASATILSVGPAPRTTTVTSPASRRCRCNTSPPSGTVKAVHAAASAAPSQGASMSLFRRALAFAGFAGVALLSTSVPRFGRFTRPNSSHRLRLEWRGLRARQPAGGQRRRALRPSTRRITRAVRHVPHRRHRHRRRTRLTGGRHDRRHRPLPVRRQPRRRHPDLVPGPPRRPRADRRRRVRRSDADQRHRARRPRVRPQRRRSRQHLRVHRERRRPRADRRLHPAPQRSRHPASPGVLHPRR